MSSLGQRAQEGGEINGGEFMLFPLSSPCIPGAPQSKAWPSWHLHGWGVELPLCLALSGVCAQKAENGD